MATPLPPMDMSDNPTGCCPRFHPEPWEGHEFSLDGLTFIRVTTRSFLYLPLNMGAVMTRMQKAIADAGSAPADRGLPLNEVYAFYTTCPHCAKAYGKNYVVLMAKVLEAA